MIETEIKQDGTERHTLIRSAPLRTLVLLLPGGIVILSPRSESNKICFLINTSECFILPSPSTETGVSRSNLDSYGCFFA